MNRDELLDQPEDLPTVPTVNEEVTSLGQITINTNVVVQIVTLAAQQVNGVVSVGSSGFVDKLTSGNAVRVEEDDNGDYAITVPVILSFGMELASVAYDIQVSVQEQVQKMTNKHVSRVDVRIDGIKTPTREKEPADSRVEAWQEDS